MITSEVTTFNSRIDIPPPPPECLNSPEAMREWLARSTINTVASGILFGYSVGTIAAAGPQDKDKPRFLYDSNDRYLGLAVWMPSLQGWTIGGQIGELRTLVRVASTVQVDLENRAMRGWRLADGEAAGIPDLTANDAFFDGSSPDWDLYTVGYTGA